MDDTKIRISSGKLVDLSDFKPEDVCLDSINKSLNNLKRFTGHYKFSRPLSVAQHTYLCTLIADRLYPKNSGLKLMCILHDMPEAYYSDLSSPLKRHLGDFYRDKIKEIDKTLYDTLWEQASWNEQEKRYVYTWWDFYKENCKKCDHISLRIEQNLMFGTIPPEGYVQEFMQNFDTRQMFEKCGEYEIDLKAMYEVYKN